MDKKFLGLGIIFKGIDEGMTKSLEGIVKGFDSTNKAITDTKKTTEAKGGPFASITKGLGLLSLSKIGSAIDDIQGAMTGMNQSKFSDLFLTLDTMSAKLGQVLDPKLMGKFDQTIKSTMVNTGLTAQETQTLAMNMTNFGRSTEETIKSLPLMGTLVGKLGVSAEEVAGMFGQGLASLRATPGQMTSLIKETVKMQKSYGLTDMIGDLPEIMSSVTTNAAKFGKVGPESASKTALSIMNLSGVFRKLGKSQKDATSASIGFADKLSDISQSVTDMRAGLSPLDDSLFEAQNALHLMGVKEQDTFKMLMEGKNNPDALIKQIHGSFSKLSDEQKLVATAHFRRVFGPDITNAINAYGTEAADAFKGAEKQAAKVGTADEAFNSLTKAMDGTVSVQEKLANSAKEYFNVTTEFANKKDYMSALQKQRAAWLDLADATSSADSILGMIMRKMDIFEKFGFAGVTGMGAGLGVLLTVASSLIYPLTKLWGMLQLFGGALWTATKFMLKIPWKMFIGGWKILIGTIKLANIAFTLLRATMLRTALVMMLNPVGALIAGLVALGIAIAGVVYYWDDIKKAMGTFFDWAGDKISVFTGFFKNTFTGVFDQLKVVWKDIKDVWAKFWDVNVSNDALLSSFATLGESLYDLLTKAWDATMAYFKAGLVKFLPDVLLKRIGLQQPEGAATVPATPAKAQDPSKVAGGTPNVAQAPDNTSLIAGMKSLISNAATSPANSAQVTPAVPVPVTAQPMAPARSVAQSAPTVAPQLGDKNFQAIVDSVLAMKDTLAKAIADLAARPVNVVLQGDAKKFFSAANKESMQAAGAAGMANMVTR